jgi:hypothetical protein
LLESPLALVRRNQLDPPPQGLYGRHELLEEAHICPDPGVLSHVLAEDVIDGPLERALADPIR